MIDAAHPWLTTLCPQQSTRILLPIEMEVAAGGARCEYRERRRHRRIL